MLNPNSESEVVAVSLRSGSSARKLLFDFDFASLAVKGRSSKGNRLTKYPVRKIAHKKAGTSTQGGIDIWYDETVGRLNREKRGRFLGKFEGEDMILVASRDGSLELTSFELTNRYEAEKIVLIEKCNPEAVITVAHISGEPGKFYVKRFHLQNSSIGASLQFTDEGKDNVPVIVTTESDPRARIEYLFGRKKEKHSDVVHLNSLVDIKGYKARGNLISNYEVVSVTPVESEKPETMSKVHENPEQLQLFGSEEKKPS